MMNRSMFKNLLLCVFAVIAILMLDTRASADNADDELTAAYRLYNSASYAEAITHYNNAILVYRARGDSLHLAHSYVNCGLSYISLQQRDSAIEYFVAAIKLGDAGAYDSRSPEYHFMSDYVQAIQDCKDAIQLDSGNAEAYLSHLEIELTAISELRSDMIILESGYSSFQFDKVRALVKRIQDETDSLYHSALATPVGLTQMERARTIIFRVASRLDNLDVLSPAEIENYNAMQVAIHARMTTLANSDQGDTITHYNEAIRLNPKNPAAYQGRGMTYFNLGQYDSAIADFTMAIELDINNVEAYQGRGRAYHRLGQYDSAIENYNKVIQLDPKAGHYGSRGMAYYFLGQYGRAIADYNEVIRLDPNNAAAYQSRGAAYSGLLQYDNAIADFSKAIELDPNYVLAYQWRGIAHNHLRQYDNAIADYNEVIRLDPKKADAYVSRASAYYSLGRYERAIADYNEVIRLDPKKADAYVSKGSAYYLLNQFDRALADLNMAIELDPNKAAAYGTRGEIYSKLGQSEKAISDFSEANRLKAGLSR